MDKRKNLRIHCSSMGGCGSTFFMKEMLDLGFQINDYKGIANDGLLKHSQYPIEDEGDFFVYIFGNPSKCLSSVYRREQQYWHYLNMNQISHNKRALYSDLPFLKNYSNFVKNDKDEFSMISQFDNWINFITDKPIIYLKYPDYFLEKDALYNILEIKNDFIKPISRKTKDFIHVNCLSALNYKISNMKPITIRNL